MVGSYNKISVASYKQQNKQKKKYIYIYNEWVVWKQKQNESKSKREIERFVFVYGTCKSKNAAKESSVNFKVKEGIYFCFAIILYHKLK